MKRFESGTWIRFYDPDWREFTAFLKERGMGDCGRYFRYGLTDQNDPVLAEIRAKTECDGKHPYSANERPSSWPKYEEPLDPLFAGETGIRTWMEKFLP